MRYVHGDGIEATKAEMVALVAYMAPRTKESAGGVGFMVLHGELTAIASDGHSAVRHRGDALDTDGTPFDERLDWQLGADAVQAVAKQMDGGDQVTLIIRDGMMLRALIADIASSQVTKPSLDISNDVANQLTIGLTDSEHFDTRIAKRPTNQLILPAAEGNKLLKVAKAADTMWYQQHIPASAVEPVRYEFAGAEDLSNGFAARWTVIVMPHRESKQSKDADE